MFEFDVLLVPHLNQEVFHPGETSRHWLHEGGYERNSFRFRHSGTLLPDESSPVFCLAQCGD